MSAFAFRPTTRTGFMLAPAYPNHWESSRLRFVCEFNPSKRQIADLDPSIPVSFIPMEKVSEDGVMKLDDERPIEAVSNGFTFFADGDVVVAKITPCFENGKGAECKGLINGFGFGTTEFHVLRSKHLDSRYLFYITASEPFRTIGATEMSGAAGQKRVPESFLQNLIVPLPPLPTQRRIAAYLDCKTRQIDLLVAEKETLLGLLEEKRASLISHAVTRGLHPKAKLKPSGIPWLGDVPVHWELKPFRHVVSIASGQVDPRADEFKQAILIAPNHIESGTGRLVGRETAIDQGAISGKYLVRQGEVIYSKIRPELRKACIAPEDCLCSADMYPMRTGGELLPEFLLYFLLGEAFSRLVVLESMRVAMPKVNREMLAPCAIPVPPLAEQTEITRVLRNTLSAIDSATQEIQTSITLLREKRSSLISAAVTGEMAVP